MTYNRIVWVDYAKALSILFVVFLHAGIPYPLKGLIRVFLIPAFFFISGIFSNISKYDNTWTFFKYKIQRILIPFFAFNILTYTFWFFVGRHFGVDENTNINALDTFFGIFTATATSLKHYVPLWFLACLFVVEGLYFVIFKKISQRKYQLIALTLLFLFSSLMYYFNIKGLPWSIDVAFSMIIFYGLGAYFKDFVLANEKITAKSITLLSGISIIASLIITLIYHLNDEAKVYVNQMGNYFLFFIGALAGIILIICLMKMISMFFKENKLILYIGQNTLIILALHLISGSFVKAITYYVFGLPLSIYKIPYMTFIYSIASVVVLIPVIYIINKYTPFLLGNFRRK